MEEIGNGVERDRRTIQEEEKRILVIIEGIFEFSSV
jgi:hypothetical protein